MMHPTGESSGIGREQRHPPDGFGRVEDLYSSELLEPLCAAGMTVAGAAPMKVGRLAEDDVCATYAPRGTEGGGGRVGRGIAVEVVPDAQRQATRDLRGNADPSQDEPSQ